MRPPHLSEHSLEYRDIPVIQGEKELAETLWEVGMVLRRGRGNLRSGEWQEGERK